MASSDKALCPTTDKALSFVACYLFFLIVQKHLETDSLQEWTSMPLLFKEGR